MSLSDFVSTLQGYKVKHNGQSFTVKGLDWSILEPIAHEFWDDIAGVFEKLSGDEEPDFMAEITAIIRKLPELEARIIAEAAREPEMADIVRLLPLPVRTEALKEIARLTFVDIEHAKKMLATLQQAWQAVETMIPETVAEALPAGLKESEGG